MGPRGSFRRAVRVGLIVALPIGALTACDSLLEVDLPAQLTEDVLVDPAGVDAQISAVMGLFECGYSAWTVVASGMADVWEPLVGQVQSIARYSPRPSTGGCDSQVSDLSYYDQFTTSRAQGAGTYDRLTNLWDDNDVDDREQKLAIMALYSAAVLDIFGEHFCEMAVDGGPLMTPDETLALGETWIGTALGHINNQPGGDFVIPNGVATSAKTMAYGLRARMRWARNDDAGALADALLVPMGFTAWIIREAPLQRRNRQNALADSPVITLYDDVNTYWQGTAVNPVTGQAWPSPIPFTGYSSLGILPDGRAVWDTGLPIRTAGDASRITPAEDAAVPDTRVGTITRDAAQAGLRQEPTKYPNADDNQPLVGWQEMWLLRAELEGGQAAIDRVNELRDFHSLPRVTYADPSDAAEIRIMIIEERRRQLFLEGRFYATKIRNTDLLWFPRNEGNTPLLSFVHEGGVRKLMPSSEYDLNPNFTDADEGSGCDPNQIPNDF